MNSQEGNAFRKSSNVVIVAIVVLSRRTENSGPVYLLPELTNTAKYINTPENKKINKIS